eukprot:9970596-Ditylum_brightwellii.AAC.1
MKQEVDEEVLEPLIRAVAFGILQDFKEQLGKALNGDCGNNSVCVDDKEQAQIILQGNQNWQCWFTVAKVKGAPCMKAKTKDCSRKKSWPESEYLGNCLHAMIVCYGGKQSGETIYQTWLQLEMAFDIKKDNGCLKNNFGTAGILKGDKHQKPPDMLINVILNVEGCIPMPAEIQVHHEEILELKESKMHLLYDIYWAESIKSLQGQGHASNDTNIMKKVVEENDKLLEEKNRKIEILEQKLLTLLQE